MHEARGQRERQATQQDMDDLPSELITAILSHLLPQRPPEDELHFANSSAPGAEPPPPLYSFSADALVPSAPRALSGRPTGLRDLFAVMRTSKGMMRLAVPLVYRDFVLESRPGAETEAGRHAKTAFRPDLRHNGPEDACYYACHVKNIAVVVHDNWCCASCLEEALAGLFGRLGAAAATNGAGLNRVKLMCPSPDPSAVPVLTSAFVELLVFGGQPGTQPEHGEAAGRPGRMTEEDFDRWLLEAGDSGDEMDLDAQDGVEDDVSDTPLPSRAFPDPSLKPTPPPLTHLLISGGWRYPHSALPELLCFVAPTLTQLVLPDIPAGPSHPLSFKSLTVLFPQLASLSLVIPDSTHPSAPLHIDLPALIALCPSLAVLRVKHRTPRRSMLGHVPVPEGAWGGWSEDTYPTPAWWQRRGMGKVVDVGGELLRAAAGRLEVLEIELPGLDGGVVDILTGMSPAEQESACGKGTPDTLPPLPFPELRALLLSGGGPGSSVGLDSRSIARLAAHPAIVRQLRTLVMTNLDIDRTALVHAGAMDLDRLELWCVGGFRLWHFECLASAIGREGRRAVLRSELQPADGTRQAFARVRDHVAVAGWELEVVVGRNTDPVAVVS
ncbi:hypothetical protein DFJ74DRAFT_490044 [Hyaloraphidium curvatum]|nr:hypothetical protein DFJ74DRAFT_490044 [Hyaloraphidium curvatum]